MFQVGVLEVLEQQAETFKEGWEPAPSMWLLRHTAVKLQAWAKPKISHPGSRGADANVHAVIRVSRPVKRWRVAVYWEE